MIHRENFHIENALRLQLNPIYFFIKMVILKLDKMYIIKMTRNTFQNTLKKKSVSKVIDNYRIYSISITIASCEFNSKKQKENCS